MILAPCRILQFSVKKGVFFVSISPMNSTSLEGYSIYHANHLMMQGAEAALSNHTLAAARVRSDFAEIRSQVLGQGGKCDLCLGALGTCVVVQNVEKMDHKKPLILDDFGSL